MAAAMTQSFALVGQRLQVRDSKPRAATKARLTSPRAEFELAPPPYALDALEPHMSKATLEFHWGKHHRTYVTNLNGQVKGTPLENKSLDEVVVETWNNGNPTPAFNNAAQAWNHTFFWESLKPNGGGEPSGDLKKAIEEAFGSFDDFKTQIKQAGATQFGSGWAWLVVDNGKLAITKTPNAENPVTQGKTPILTLDVWEHAYYLDVQNRRPDYLTTVVDQLINWDKVAERYHAAL
jgi:Fe-Mn family superoxide dismutase